MIFDAPRFPSFVRWTRFHRHSGGNVAVIFSLVAPALLAAMGATIDYAGTISGKHALQSIADNAALGGAQATRLGNATSTTITNTVANIVAANAHGASISPATSVATGMASVTVTLTQDLPMRFGAMVGVPTTRVTATATAKVSGGAPLCVASLAATDPKLASVPNPTLDTKGKLTLALLAIDVALLPNPGLLMTKGAKITAPNCFVSTNLPKPYSIAVYDTSKLTARSIQSGGGFTGAVGVNYSTTPGKDSPAAADPLQSLPTPNVPGGCTYTNMNVSGGAPTLAPGVYCGGLHISNSASVTLLPGVYIIKDGSFIVDSASTLSGNGVGFYLTATAPVSWSKFPNIYFGSDTHISLSAAATGEMAGVLFFEDRALPNGALHAILSNDARNLLGTIYLSRGFLGVASTSPVADQSAYTIIVANALLLYGGPELILNTNYSATAVPVPQGVGPKNATAYISQ